MPQIAGNQHNPNRSPFDDYPTHPDWASVPAWLPHA